MSRFDELLVEEGTRNTADGDGREKERERKRESSRRKSGAAVSAPESFQRPNRSGHPLSGVLLPLIYHLYLF